MNKDLYNKENYSINLIRRISRSGFDIKNDQERGDNNKVRIRKRRNEERKKKKCKEEQIKED